MQQTSFYLKFIRLSDLVGFRSLQTYKVHETEPTSGIRLRRVWMRLVLLLVREQRLRMRVRVVVVLL